MRTLALACVVVLGCGDDAERAGEVAADVEVEVDAEVTGEVNDEVRPEVDAEVADDTVEADVDVGPEVDAEVEVEVADDTVEADVEVGPEVDGAGDASDAEWVWEAGPSLPNVVQENAVLAVGDALWVLGGFQNLALVDRVRVLDDGADAWRDGPSLPRALHHLNAAVVAGEVYVVGSLEGFAFSATGDAWRLDPRAATPAWREVTAMPSARRRGSAGVAVVGADIIVAGGFRGGAVAEVDAFDTARSEDAAAWRTLPDLPGARDHGAAVALGGTVYYVGGRDSDISAVKADLWALDLADVDAGWIAKAPLPTARGGIAAAVYDGLVVVLGGEGNEAVASGVFPDVEAYDPARDAWLVLPPMPTPRHGTGAVALGGVLWSPGGADVQAFGASDVVERLVRRR